MVNNFFIILIALGLAKFTLAAGGGNLFGTPAGMYVYDAMTGAQIVECLPSFDTSAMLMNDVVVIDNKAYWTLSFSNKIINFLEDNITIQKK